MTTGIPLQLPGTSFFTFPETMNTVHGMIAFLRAEADLAEARAKQLRLTAALVQSNQERPASTERTYSERAMGVVGVGNVFWLP
jgi:hypothetical protein